MADRRWTDSDIRAEIDRIIGEVRVPYGECACPTCGAIGPAPIDESGRPLTATR